MSHCVQWYWQYQIPLWTWPSLQRKSFYESVVGSIHCFHLEIHFDSQHRTCTISSSQSDFHQASYNLSVRGASNDENLIDQWVRILNRFIYEFWFKILTFWNQSRQEIAFSSSYRHRLTSISSPASYLPPLTCIGFFDNDQGVIMFAGITSLHRECL